MTKKEIENLISQKRGQIASYLFSGRAEFLEERIAQLEDEIKELRKMLKNL